LDLPSISVIIPTCDRPRLLVEAVQSVLAQSRPPVELLVVDDSRSGGAEAALADLSRAAPFPVRSFSGPGGGPGAARNIGIRAACGELVAFLDDDDLWRPEKLDWQATWFAWEPMLGLLGACCTRWAGHAGPALPALPSRSGRRPCGLRFISRSALMLANRLPLSSVVIRRRCLEESGGFDASLPLAQDWDLWLRVAERWQVAILSAPLTIYRVHFGQRSRDQIGMRRAETEVIRRALERDPGSRALRGVACRRLTWAHYRLARLLMRQRQIRSAYRELKKALSLSPFHPLVWSSFARCALAKRAFAGEVGP